MNLAEVENATVELPRLRGRGVLIPGGYIVTAAHCVEITTNGDTAANPHTDREQVKTRAEQYLWLTVRAVEPSADIALLGIGEQCSPDEEQAFQAFSLNTKPVPLFQGDLPTSFDKPIPVQVYDLNRSWVDGFAATNDPTSPCLGVLTEREIEGGASGGPVITADGKLLAVVSSWDKFSTMYHRGRTYHFGHCPRPLTALPAWAVNEIREATAVLSG
jgi:hypothetical protein